MTAVTPTSHACLGSQALGREVCVGLLTLRGAVSFAPFCHYSSGSERLYDTPKEAQPAGGRARVQTQAGWGRALDRGALLDLQGSADLERERCALEGAMIACFHTGGSFGLAGQVHGVAVG